MDAVVLEVRRRQVSEPEVGIEQFAREFNRRPYDGVLIPDEPGSSFGWRTPVKETEKGTEPVNPGTDVGQGDGRASTNSG